DQTRLEMLQENQQEIFRNFSDKDTNETIEESDREIEFSDNSTKDDLSEPFEYSGLLEDIGLFESKLAGLIQTEQPGQEMLVAYKVAKEIGAEIYLIDKSINDISKIMEEEVSKEEADKFQEMIDELLFDQRIVVKPIDKEKKENNGKSLLEGLDNLDEDEEINLNEVIEIFKDEDSLGEILSIFGQNFPKLFSILLEDRNSYMIKQIKEISLNHKKIAVVVGYGHVKEVVNGLKEINGDFEIKIIE
ncbi:MAG: TraB/GumN family protein, partial [Candidatus Heimdallarchaeota archaeon]